MSIWATAGETVDAVLNTTAEINSSGAGDELWILSAATATSWHDKIRVDGWDSDFATSIDWLLDADNAEVLRDALTAAINEVRRVYPTNDNPSTES